MSISTIIISDRLYDILDVIQRTQPEKNEGVLDGQIVEAIVTKITDLDQSTKKQLRYTISNISFLQYVFVLIHNLISKIFQAKH